VVTKTPSGSYALTQYGEGLRTPVIGLGLWGLGLLAGVETGTARPDMVALCMTGAVPLARLTGIDLVCEVHTPEAFTMTAANGTLTVASRPAATSSALVLECSAETFIDLALGTVTLYGVRRTGAATVLGRGPDCRNCSRRSPRLAGTTSSRPPEPPRQRPRPTATSTFPAVRRRATPKECHVEPVGPARGLRPPLPEPRRPGARGHPTRLCAGQRRGQPGREPARRARHPARRQGRAELPEPAVLPDRVLRDPEGRGGGGAAERAAQGPGGGLPPGGCGREGLLLLRGHRGPGDRR